MEKVFVYIYLNKKQNFYSSIPKVMRTIFVLKATFLLLVLLGLTFSSCKKKENSEPAPDPVFQGTTNWECTVIELTPDTITHYYVFSLKQQGSLLTGDVMVRDSAEMIRGVISGKVLNDSVFINAAFEKAAFDFSFRGVAVDTSGTMDLSGALQTSPVSVNGNDQVMLIISPVSDPLTPQFYADNPYVFRKVHASNHPNDSSVIFIHGMTGDLTHWDEMISQLSPAFLEKHDVYVYQYNWKDSIMINGRILYDSVVAAGLTNPIIVAHSMGGLVARAYISKGGAIAQLVALGTPHLGSPLARLTNLFVFSGFPGPRDMAPESGFIQNLLINANDINNRSKFVVFGGQMKGRFKLTKGRLKWVWAEDYYVLMDKLGYDGFIFFGNPSNDGLVPVASGLFEGYPVKERKPILEWVDHRNLRTPTIATQVLSYINGL